MKRIFVSLMTLLCLSVLGHVASAYAEEPVLNVDEVIKNVDPDTTTKSQFKEYFKTIEGKKVAGVGKVVHVLPGGSNTNRVTILTKASEPEKGYNVVLYTSQDAKSELSKDDKITFEGQISRVNPYKGASIDIIRGTYKPVD